MQTLRGDNVEEVYEAFTPPDDKAYLLAFLQERLGMEPKQAESLVD